MKKISTYLIHGSLGCGKTTLLKNILKFPEFKKSVVIENEFANYSVDKELLDGCQVKILDVSGGCVCCTSGREFFEALKLVSLEKKVENLFIETTGVAKSVSLIKQLLLSREFEEYFELIKNIYVIDLIEDELKQIKEQKMLDILMADLIVLNKADAVSEGKIEEFSFFLLSLGANFIKTKFGKVAKKYLLSSSKSKAPFVLSENLSQLMNEPVDHLKNIFYQVIYPKKRISEKEIEKLIRKLSSGKNFEIKRAKGVFTDQNGSKILLNATKNYFEFSKVGKKIEDVIVFIGKNLTKENTKPIINALC